jgi:hypothetical protein
MIGEVFREPTLRLPGRLRADNFVFSALAGLGFLLSAHALLFLVASGSNGGGDGFSRLQAGRSSAASGTMA